MNPRERDVLEDMAGRAHKDADPVAKKAADRHGVTPRTARRYATSGPPVLKDYLRYLRVVEDPWRIAKEGEIEAKKATVSGKSTPYLIVRYHELLEAECDRECEDRRLTVTRGTKWLARAQASARDSRIDAEKSAIERLFAARGVREEEVFG